MQTKTNYFLVKQSKNGQKIWKNQKKVVPLPTKSDL